MYLLLYSYFEIIKSDLRQKKFIENSLYIIHLRLKFGLHFHCLSCEILYKY